jgi:hypothetical protein
VRRASLRLRNAEGKDGNALNEVRLLREDGFRRLADAFFAEIAARYPA